MMEKINLNRLVNSFLNASFKKKVVGAVLVIGIILSLGWAAQQGVNISLSLELQAQLDYLETQQQLLNETLNIPVNSTISAMLKTVSYIISTHGSYSCLINGTDDRAGRLESYSTNTSAVIDPVIVANTTILFREGNYYINNLSSVDVSNIHFIGSGWGTQFTIGATGGFNISNTSALSDISFENIYWMDSSGGSGAGVSAYGITSAMPAQQRISHFVFSGNKVTYFRKAGTIFLYLTNLEVSTISNNYFIYTRTAFIELNSFYYDAGNNKIFNNVFYGGYDVANENAIRLKATNGNVTYASAVTNVYSWGNQWFGDTSYGTTFYAWNATATGSYCHSGLVNSRGDRYENTRVLISTGYDTTAWQNGGVWIGNTISSQASGSPFFSLDNYTRATVITHNEVAIQTGDTFVDDNYGSASYSYMPNQIIDNMIYDTGRFINGTYLSKVYGNINFNFGYIANWKAPNSVSPYDGYASTFTNGTTYRVTTCPVHFNVTGGTTVNITITDYTGNAFINGATSLFWFPMRIDYTITCVYATSPTAVVIFDGN